MRRVADRTTPNDRPGDPLAETLLSELADDPDQVDLIPGVDDLVRAPWGILAHAHVERAGPLIGEPSLPHVELMRGDSEVE
jgi:hypothetical protein